MELLRFGGNTYLPLVLANVLFFTPMGMELAFTGEALFALDGKASGELVQMAGQVPAPKACEELERLQEGADALAKLACELVK